MSLPEGFQFNQGNLQDYVDCQRRFQLRYLLRQDWPAVEAEPYLENEQRIDQGAKFHQIILQHLVGIPEEQIYKSIAGDELIKSWWNNYIHSVREGVLKLLYGSSILRFEEITLSVPINRYRLVAKFDFILKQEGNQWTILDWKTAQNIPKRRWLEERLQTHVYPYVLAAAGNGLINSTMIAPEQIEMMYWFANRPEQPERFEYDITRFQDDGRMLSNLVATISQRNEPVFSLTPDIKRCTYCPYRSLCNRGVQPGDLKHIDEWIEPEKPGDVTIDFDQIGEIEL